MLLLKKKNVFTFCLKHEGVSNQMPARFSDINIPKV